MDGYSKSRETRLGQANYTTKNKIKVLLTDPFQNLLKQKSNYGKATSA